MKTQAAPASMALRMPASSMRCSPEPASTGFLRGIAPRRIADLLGTGSLELVEKGGDPFDVRVLVVVLVEDAREPDRIPGVIPLVELLAAGEARDRGVVREPEEADALAGVRGRGLEVALHVLRSRTVDLRERRNGDDASRPDDLDDLAHPMEHLRKHLPHAPEWSGIGNV